MKQLVSAIVLCISASLSAAQTPGFGACKPAIERTGILGCWILTDTALGRMDKSEVYWHLDRYTSRSEAEQAKGPHGVVIDALGKEWLMTIEGKSWRPEHAGTHVADIGPLKIEAGKEYSAVFMEAVFKPGMTSSVHRHSGPEAWYTATGETCLETPNGKIVGAAGKSAVVPAGPPMFLTATGKTPRRAITLILHESSKAPTTMEHQWKPKGLCK